jgi:hypothetical protein
LDLEEDLGMSVDVGQVKFGCSTLFEDLFSLFLLFFFHF